MSTPYEQFIAANAKLYECYESVQPEVWETMSVEARGEVCSSERNIVLSFMKGSDLKFSTLIKNRLQLTQEQWTSQPSNSPAYLT